MATRHVAVFKGIKMACLQIHIVDITTFRNVRKSLVIQGQQQSMDLCIKQLPTLP